MRKNLTFLLTSLAFFIFLNANMTSAQAQCSVTGINSEGASVTIAISCDFPVFINTGNDAVDNANYKSQKDAWIAAHPDDYAAFISLSDMYFEIAEDDFNAMPEERREAIAAKPELYHIIQ